MIITSSIIHLLVVVVVFFLFLFFLGEVFSFEKETVPTLPVDDFWVIGRKSLSFKIGKEDIHFPVLLFPTQTQPLLLNPNYFFIFPFLYQVWDHGRSIGGFSSALEFL